ncbi:MAG: APC family permease [Verrucomicrobia bacterium]|nr:APC family permease [Verrucomicrobiota bacterium]
MGILDYLLGRPLASSEDKEERVGWLAGISVFGLDALSSAAYGPEAALTALIPLGVAGLGYGFWITVAVSTILLIVYFSYRQTIVAYPAGAGSYTVAKENLGPLAGVFAAVALLIDYTLNVAVGISAGIGALVSAFPALQPLTLYLCLAVLAALVYMNLRGIRDAGFALMPPTYLFVGCLSILILLGLGETLLAGGHPQAVIAPPAVASHERDISWWLFLKAFAAGCTAMTGVEAVSNGVLAFKEPAVKTARRTLTIIVAILIFLLLGVAYLVSVFHITATDPGAPGYQSILSMIAQAVAGRGIFYYLSITAILLVLSLSANTSFADFPRVCRTVAHDGYLPASFTIRGRRLVYTEGILLLTILAASLLIAFNGVTDRLIPLFAIGAFLAFTLSQAGMVMHWLRSGEPRARLNAAINGFGAVATGITFVIVLVTKFAEGAWLVVLILPALFILMLAIKHHYTKVAAELAIQGPIKLQPRDMIAVIPIVSVNHIAQRALEIAYGLSNNIHVLHIQDEQEEGGFVDTWHTDVQPAIDQLGLPRPTLVVLQSPFRRMLSPTLNYIWQLERDNPENSIAVLVPQLIESHWYYSFLHNQRASILRAILLLKGRNRIVVVNVPWNLECQLQAKGIQRKEPWDAYPVHIER